jgi:hypothetical protein
MTRTRRHPRLSPRKRAIWATRLKGLALMALTALLALAYIAYALA